MPVIFLGDPALRRISGGFSMFGENLNCRTLEEESARIIELIAMIENRFLGFRMPPPVKAAYDNAQSSLRAWISAGATQQADDFREQVTNSLNEVRVAIENCLAGFFKHSTIYFRARLQRLGVHADLADLEDAIKERIRNIEGMSRAAWIDLSEAAQMYRETYDAIERLRMFNDERTQPQPLVLGQRREQIFAAQG